MYIILKVQKKAHPYFQKVICHHFNTLVTSEFRVDAVTINSCRRQLQMNPFTRQHGRDMVYVGKPTICLRIAKRKGTQDMFLFDVNMKSHVSCQTTHARRKLINVLQLWAF